MLLYVLVEDIKNNLKLFNNTHVFGPNINVTVSHMEATKIVQFSIHYLSFILQVYKWTVIKTLLDSKPK